MFIIGFPQHWQYVKKVHENQVSMTTLSHRHSVSDGFFFRNIIKSQEFALNASIYKSKSLMNLIDSR